GRPSPVLEVLPRLATELRQRGNGAVGADVARDLAELLVRDIEAVGPAETEKEGVARGTRDLLRPEARQLAEALGPVDDVGAGAEVGERLQGATADAALTRRALAKDLRVGEQREAEVAPDEASARRRNCEQQLRLARQRLAFLEQPRRRAAQQVLLAQRLAEV